MSHPDEINLLKKRIVELETDIKHLRNDLRLTREEYEESTRKYFDVYSNLDRIVNERTSELKETNLRLKAEIEEREHTEQEKEDLENQLRQSQKLQAIGTLAGGIAHDFNNILSAIIGYADLALDEIPKESVTFSNIKQVLKAGDRAKRLIQHILTFSRQYEHELKPVQIHYIIEEALNMLRASIPTTIDIHSTIKSKGIILGDPTQIHQVLINLCTNAAQAMDKNGGKLEVSLTDVILKAGDLEGKPGIQPGPFIKLVVSDNGPGIDPGIINFIFDPYFTTKEVGKGSGMGLSVVHGIVKSCHGVITVESTSNGATFSVYFPAVNLAVEQPAEEADSPIPSGNEKILFVDDEKELAAIGKQMLEHYGYHVMARTSSIEAIEAFRANKDSIDLVITDQTMPNMTGAEMSQEMLKIRPDIPIILCTGYSSSISAETAKAIGIREFIMKPLIRKEFITTVRQVLNRHKKTS